MTTRQTSSLFLALICLSGMARGDIKITRTMLDPESFIECIEDENLILEEKKCESVDNSQYYQQKQCAEWKECHDVITSPAGRKITDWEKMSAYGHKLYTTFRPKNPKLAVELKLDKDVPVVPIPKHTWESIAVNGHKMYTTFRPKAYKGPVIIITKRPGANKPKDKVILVLEGLGENGIEPQTTTSTSTTTTTPATTLPPEPEDAAYEDAAEGGAAGASGDEGSPDMELECAKVSKCNEARARFCYNHQDFTKESSHLCIKWKRQADGHGGPWF